MAHNGGASVGGASVGAEECKDVAFGSAGTIESDGTDLPGDFEYSKYPGCHAGAGEAGYEYQLPLEDEGPGPPLVLQRDGVSKPCVEITRLQLLCTISGKNSTLFLDHDLTLALTDGLRIKTLAKKIVDFSLHECGIFMQESAVLKRSDLHSFLSQSGESGRHVVLGRLLSFCDAPSRRLKPARFWINVPCFSVFSLSVV